jgi:hypothetical protein
MIAEKIVNARHGGDRKSEQEQAVKQLGGTRKAIT